MFEQSNPTSNIRIHLNTDLFAFEGWHLTLFCITIYKSLFPTTYRYYLVQREMATHIFGLPHNVCNVVIGAILLVLSRNILSPPKYFQHYTIINKQQNGRWLSCYVVKLVACSLSVILQIKVQFPVKLKIMNVLSFPIKLICYFIYLVMLRG